MANNFRCQPWFQNQTIVILGGGPSLKGFDLSGIENHRVITVNNAFKLHLPDILFYADTRWWRWHGHEVPAEFPGRIVSCSKAAAHVIDPRVCRMVQDYGHRNGPDVLTADQTRLTGPDGGYMAINLAYHLGASRIILLGYDMGFTNGEAHWHPDHPIPTPEENYTNLFAPFYPALVETLQKRGIEVLLCTPSRLDCIPMMPFKEAIALPDRQRGPIS